MGGAIYSGSIAPVMYALWFGSEKALALQTFLVTSYGACGLFLNPVCGFIMDRVGFKPFFVFTVLFVYVQNCVVWMRVVEAQMLLGVAFATWQCCFKTIDLKYPVFYAPPELYGVMHGGMGSLAGFFALFTTQVAAALQPTDPKIMMLPNGLLGLGGG